MNGETLDSLIAITKEKVQALFLKPKLTEKLLRKPPFRFLHDIITAVTKATGFGEGLYNETEMNSMLVIEKQAKIAYLDKIILLVGICKVILLFFDDVPITTTVIMLSHEG